MSNVPINVVAVYDDVGYIIMVVSELPHPLVGVKTMNILVPDGLALTGINVTVTPHEPIFTEAPKSLSDDLVMTVAQVNQNLSDFISFYFEMHPEQA